METLFYDIFEALPRQGPGDSAITRRAFEAIDDLPDAPAILDVGCGSGMQTVDLAGLTGGRIVAVDNHRPFLKMLHQRARQTPLRATITAVQGDMTALPFKDGRFDLIWSEGAAYSMGFGNALEKWRKLLRPGGVLAASHVAWFHDDPPAPARAFWEVEFPEITTNTGNRACIAAAGYGLIDHFPLPPETWWRHYYRPMEAVLARMRAKYAGNEEAKAIFDAFDIEIDTHRHYGEDYGYYFYIMRR